MSQFTHLHLHTEYSMLDGANKLKELALTLKEQGATSVAMTDHGNMFGAIDFYQTMRSHGLKPIIGLEAYLHNMDDLSDKSSRQRFHLCLYAKNEIGYKNLMYLSSQSYIHGLYYYPRINKKLLEKHSEGLICSSACLQGEVNWHLNIYNERNVRFGAKGYEAAKEAALWYKRVFGDDFYFEIMRHGINDQRAIDDDIIRLSKELDIKIIATNDTHYTFKERAEAHEVFMCIGMGKRLNDPDRMRHSVKEFYVKTSEQMSELFADIPEAISNTQDLANKCNLELKLGDPTPPNFKFTREYAKEFDITLPQEKVEFSFENDDLVFEHLCRKGLEERLKFVDEGKHDEYKARLETEIKIIKEMKFSGYMLIVHDFIKVAKDKNIPVGPGRGSAAGSLVAYALKITDIDPLPYNLLFERFLNPERVSMPDIDVDFCRDRRDEVIDYVIDKYGSDKVAQVSTFNKLLAKGVIRDVARVLDISLQDVDEFIKLVPEELKITLDEAYEKEPKIKEFIEKHPKGKELWEYAKALEGLNRNAGMHAAGLVISNESLWNKTPLFRQSKNDERHLITQYSKDHLEDVDLIKFDFLGLKTLTLIHNAIKLIKERYNKDIVWESIDVNDSKVYKTIQSGNTLGIFQIESDGMQSLNARLKPENFEDLIAVLALYRPGPMESGMLDDFIDRKHGLKKIIYPFDVLKEVLEPTYGVIVYQEQVMQIVQIIGGFSLGGADVVRRAMGKKDPEKMAKLKDEFANGAEKQGYNRAKAEDLWELIVKFAGYGFNKSHSAAYGLITFQTAYLKTYYPSEFMAALLTSEQNKIENVAMYIEEMKKMNIKLLPPRINKAISEFSAIKQEDGTEAIVYGLGAIKSVGGPAIENVLELRSKNGDFKDLHDFLSKIDTAKINRRTLEGFIKAGSFDDFGFTRKCLFNNLDTLAESARKMAEVRKNSASSLFGAEELNADTKINIVVDNSEFEAMEKLGYEKEILGIYISGHPLDKFFEEINGIEYTKSIDFENLKGGGEILSIGKVENFKSLMSKSGKRYGILEILDFYSSFEVTIFESHIEEIETIIKERKNDAFGFVLGFRNDDARLSFTLKAVRTLDEIKSGDFKAVKKYSSKKFEKKNDYTKEPMEFENSIIELDLSRLNKELIYEIHEIARNAHNPNEKGNKKLVLRVISAGSCLLYHTDFIISDRVSEKILSKYVG
ncbi:DNA polymerase III subunit alpha [Campylobacter upsaliensis]|uniref:DNA polymerase III subunit alpha n=3 Tax=Campylobacter upsaliensis TaxID=28080 RepID=A0A828QV12_CAMUP|nr:DNA polymerase III subunit alpha [Campylobacter upsaliensis]EAB5282382.1 DNA polymerase III subunit alpha [Campylobacter upsaliensis]EAH5887044.1 DNA polymerase III subunit alpha [Campylobacter upsaliensis]EAI4357187.1 DNA polymerase III subunit alpha [Campylobacter upsaliensis]EAI7129690.1 DNA polymerase III subunit alpha [Campylobacter upsaliensis]EAI7260174.1 DNA polymerase III subunit alpha [Campylobacter upsaliensis]